MHFLKRLAHVVGDLLTSKKAIATISGIVAHRLGADPTTVASIAAYVVGQGIADHGKEAAKAAAQAALAAAEQAFMAKVKTGGALVIGKDGNPR